jgi:hypothetical protein
MHVLWDTNVTIVHITRTEFARLSHYHYETHHAHDNNVRHCSILTDTQIEGSFPKSWSTWKRLERMYGPPVLGVCLLVTLRVYKQ